MPSTFSPRTPARRRASATRIRRSSSARRSASSCSSRSSLGFFVAHSSAGSAQAKLSAARIELGKLSLVKRPHYKVPKLTRPIIPIPAVTGQETALLQAVSGALATRIAWDRILREFSLVVPDDVSITTMNLTAPPTVAARNREAPAATPTGLVLIGTTYSHDSVARLLSRLMLIPDLTDVTLSSSTAATSAAAPGVQFNIAANVKGAPVPAAAGADHADRHHDDERAGS